ncbi:MULTISPECIES: SDR family oxidoreductase [unclassified Beijerinckia]|uniref:SDR family oxidoreductase n=1 Tax=unclassified Beijerinckia TaxID=2638183 RepID=UPI001FCD62A5|nr:MULTISPECIES: SDR family oxidoreductase [unclassified Beijerinckia]
MEQTTSAGVALVTGAARRIGRAISKRLTQEGYALALHASQRSREEAQLLAREIADAGGRAEVVIADLMDMQAPAQLFEAARRLGAVTLLVNNASLFEQDTPDTFDTDFFDRAMAVNLRAPCALAALMARALPKGASGAIVNIADQRVWRLNPQFFSYTLTKAALWTATQTMAQAFAPRLRVNAVGPGPVLPNTMDGDDGFQREAANIPLERAVAPEEVAEAVAYLAQARSVTGQMIAVDGGQHIAWKTPDVITDL